MKSFNEHINVKREELKEGDPFDDLTDLLWVGAAGAGLFGLKKGWDKFGKDAVASLPFAPDKWKAAKKDREKEREKEKEKIAKTLDPSTDDTEKAQAKLDKEKQKTDDDQTKADAKMLDYKKDSKGRIANQPDAQEYKDLTGEAPDGWVTSPGGKGKEQAGYPKKGIVLSVSDARAFDAQRKKEAETERQYGKENPKKKIEPKTDSHKLKGNMTITESNELQAIMALDDEGIKAEINRKGQVVVKKKDLKKAEKALKKSFRKGGEPKLVGEHKGTEPHKHPHEDEELDEDDLTSYLEMKMSAAAKKKKAIWAKSSAGKASLKKSKIRAKKVASGSIKIDKAKGRAMAKARAKGGIRNEFVPRTAYEVVSEARSRIIEVADEHAATELYLFMQNERDLQRQKDSIIKNIVRKKKAEKYDHSKAPKLWSYWVDNGAKAYDKEYSSPGAKTFDKDTRQSVAIQFANEYNTEIDLGNYS